MPSWQCWSRQGDTSAFEVLVRRYFGAVYGLAYGWTRNAQDAEDLTQEAFYRAFERLRSLRDPSSFPAWLRTLTRNLCRMWHRSGRVILSLDDPQFDELKKEVADRVYPKRGIRSARTGSGGPGRARRTTRIVAAYHHAVLCQRVVTQTDRTLSRSSHLDRSWQKEVRRMWRSNLS